MVLEAYLDEIALAHADELSGRFVAERPVHVGHALGELFDVLFDFEVENDARCVVSRDRWRNIGRGREHGSLDALRRIERFAGAERARGRIDCKK